jgi:hypothetical protein
MSTSKKEQVRQLLNEKDFEKIAELSLVSSSVVRYLLSFLYSTDDLLHWRAAEALGRVADIQFRNGINDGRNIPQRLLWSLMEESGATAWPATEALGAIVHANPAAFPDFSRIIMGYMEDPVLQRGVLWSAKIISDKRPDLLQDFIPQIIELLSDSNPIIRGHAAWALGSMRDRKALQKLENLVDDLSKLAVYEHHELIPTDIHTLSTHSIERIKKEAPAK